MSNTTSQTDTRLDNVRESLTQYEEGAITFLEFLFYAWGKVTQEDVDEYNQFHPEAQLRLEQFRG